MDEKIPTPLNWIVEDRIPTQSELETTSYDDIFAYVEKMNKRINQ